MSMSCVCIRSNSINRIELICSVLFKLFDLIQTHNMDINAYLCEALEPLPAAKQYGRLAEAI